MLRSEELGLDSCTSAILPSAGLPALHPVTLLDFFLVTHNSMRYMESLYFFSGRKVDLRAYGIRRGGRSLGRCLVDLAIARFSFLL